MTDTDTIPDRARLLDVVRSKALRQFDEPRRLASGEMSRDFIDAKAGLSRGEDLRLACEVMDATVAGEGIGWEAVGGLTMGADQFAHGIALLHDDREWFVVRKQPKGRGTDQLVEGAALREGTRVVLVDDIVTTGGSIQVAHQRVLDTGATVVAAVTLVDRGDAAAVYFTRHGVPYLPVFTYTDLGIAPVGGG